MTEHASLANPPTKPLIDPKEIREMAHKAVAQEVDDEINRLVHTETVNEQILQTLEQNKQVLDEIKEIVQKSSEENQKTITLKLDVLRKLKAKLETVT